MQSTVVGKHLHQRRRFFVILLLSLPFSIFLFLWTSPSRPFARSLDSYITSGMPWTETETTSTPDASCWNAPTLYHCFRRSNPGSSDNPLRSAADIEALLLPTQPWHPSHCINNFFTSGEPCSTHRPAPLDVVWTWVNGSDSLLRHEFSDAVNAMIGQPRKNSVSATSGKLYR